MTSKRKKKSTPQRFASITRFITEQIPSIRTVQLVKTIFFLEYEYLRRFGETLTEVPVIRIPMGPVPGNYEFHFDNLHRAGIINIHRKASDYGTQRFFPNTVRPFEHNLTNIELGVLMPIINWVKSVVYSRPEDATRVIKEKSYETEPMRRYLREEEIAGKKKIGGYVLRPPYFSPEDIDPLAPYRRAYRNQVRSAAKFSVEDMLHHADVLADLRPYLEATNEYAIGERAI